MQKSFAIIGSGDLKGQAGGPDCQCTLLKQNLRLYWRRISSYSDLYRAPHCKADKLDRFFSKSFRRLDRKKSMKSRGHGKLTCCILSKSSAGRCRRGGGGAWRRRRGEPCAPHPHSAAPLALGAAVRLSPFAPTAPAPVRRGFRASSGGDVRKRTGVSTCDGRFEVSDLGYCLDAR